MISNKFTWRSAVSALAFLWLGLLCAACEQTTSSLAPYQPGIVKLSTLSVEPGVYAPRVSWIGGYVTAVGVDTGKTARLDSALIWLIYQAGDNVHYQPRFGQVPQGATDLTTTYGGSPASRLLEDHAYTFWLAKEDAWGAISANPGKVLISDTTATVLSRISNDTLFLASSSFIVSVEPIDVYIGIRNVRAVGRLGVINVVQTDTSNSPIITFRITQTSPAPPDTLLTNMGICSGQQYDVSGVIWEVLAADSSITPPQFWTLDVIASPVIAGERIPGTAIFTEYPAGGLLRNQTYYVWIANKAWDQRSRLRSTYNYASATFETF